ncbi:hypothetical protein [Nocardia sp. NPDC004260]
MLAVAEMSGNLARPARTPDPGPDPLAVAAILLDGLDVVVVDVSPAPWRRRGCGRRSPDTGQKSGLETLAHWPSLMPTTRWHGAV